MKIKFTSLLGVLVLIAMVFVACNEDVLHVEPTVEEQMSKIITYESNVIPGEYIVVLDESNAKIDIPAELPYADKQSAMREEAASLLEKTAIAREQLKTVYGATIKGFMAKLSEKEAITLAGLPEVRYLEQNRTISINGGPPFGGGGGDTNCTYTDSGETPWGISFVGTVNYTGNNVAWVLDTGIDLDHPDLNVDASRGFIDPNMSGKGSGSLDDGNGHGTHCAGTIAAKADGVGVLGVAAGATVIPVKVLNDRGSGSFSGVIAGVDYVGANGVAGDVANMSLGGGFSQSVNDAVIAASSGGVKFVVAAGNDGADANNYSPASANGPNVYTISAVDCNLAFASFSNYANPPVDYAAPGVNVKSTWKDGGYNTISGTSMAAPHAAGVLLVSSGKSCASASGDPDGNPDPIICL